MSLEQLIGKQDRLVRELARAFNGQPWPGALIDRLAEDLAATEREIASIMAAQQGLNEELRHAA